MGVWSEGVESAGVVLDPASACSQLTFADPNNNKINKFTGCMGGASCLGAWEGLGAWSGC